MQSWHGTNGQQPGNGAQQPPSHDNSSWQQDFAFTGPNDHFDAGQDWSQPLPDQVAYAQQLNPQGATSSHFFESQHHDDASYLSEAFTAAQPAFHGGHDGIAIEQQYQQDGQGALDPAFENLHPDLYGRPGKTGLDGHQGHVNHSLIQGQIDPRFTQQRDLSYGHAATSSFPTANASQYGGQNIIQQTPQPTQHDQNPAQQQFGNIQGAHVQTGAYQNHGAHHATQQPQPLRPVPAYSQIQANHRGMQYQAQGLNDFQSQQQSQIYGQPAFSSPYASHQQQPLEHVERKAPTQPLPANSVSTPLSVAPGSSQLDINAAQPATAEEAQKKRKRPTKTAPETPVSDVVSFQIESHIDNSVSKLAEIDSLPPPASIAQEEEMMRKFDQRSQAAKARFPPIVGLPYLYHDGTTKLPIPKSYDKLVPLVALPSRSGRSLVPELGYELPCQIQGQFSAHYQPSADKAGLDERKSEAKVLLDTYNQSMKQIGKRQPKYTEYPHAFKEQLKADEANKNKGKKLKKDTETSQRTKPIRAEVRPADPVDAAVWDVLGIVHINPAVSRTTQLIASRVQQTGDFFIKLRGEMNRAKQELDQRTTDKASEPEIGEANRKYEQKKSALTRTLDAVIEHADDAVFDNIGGHQKLISSLVNVLITCIKMGDFNGKLPKVALELFTQLPMTKKIAETTNFETVRKRFAEKGDDEVKRLARDIALKVKKVLKPTESEGYAGTSAANRSKVAKAGDSASVKRGRDEDGVDNRSVKKVVVEAGSSSLSKKLSQAKAAGPSAIKVKPAASSALPAKPRAVSITKPVEKSENSPAAEDRAKSEFKRPTTKSEPRPAPSKAASSSSSAVSGIGSLLASISTSKPDAPVSAPKEVKPSELVESTEARAKRLRREARRSLRVSWKPDNELVKVKVFEKEESEDEGRAHNMIKDAADDRSEGMVLKQRADIDEDDDEDDIPYSPWTAPAKAAWASLSEDARNKNYVTRGGNVSFSTNEQQWIKEREQRELMAIYTDPDDIPASPRSPAPDTGGNPPGKIANLPQDDEKFKETQLRWTEEQQMGVDGALYSAIRRLTQRKAPSNQIDNILSRVAGAVSTSTQAKPRYPDVAAGPSSSPLAIGPPAEDYVLGWLRSDKVKDWYDPSSSSSEIAAHHYANVETRLAGTAIEALVRYLAVKPYPATSPPDWLLSDEERVREWWHGYNKEVATRQRKADEQRARIALQENNAQMSNAAAGQSHTQDWAAWLAQAQQQQQPQQAYTPYMALLQQMQQQPSQSNDQLQSILAAMSQPTQAQQQQQQPYLNPNEDSYQQIMRLAQLAQGGAQQQQQPGQATQPLERDQERMDESLLDWDPQREGDRDWDQHADGSGKGKKLRSLPVHKPINKALIGTKPCTFWQQGKCARGDKCTFRHD